MQALYWMIAITILVVIEIATLGLTTIWFAAGALVAFFLSLLGVNIYIQFFVFILISALLLYFIRPFAEKYINANKVATNVESIIGEEARVTKTIDNFNQQGQAIINGQEWTARSENDEIIKEGTKVKIIKISGVKLIVRELKEK